MRYKPFGKTGMDISSLAMGTWGLDGARWGGTDTDEAVKGMLAMVDMGVNLIDTAPVYGDGISEEFVGDLVKNAGIRDKVYIATKGGLPIGEHRATGKKRDAGRDYMTQGLEDSLRRLKTDYVDILLVHWPDVDTPFEETMTAMMDLKKAGKVRHIGVSNFSVEQMTEFGKYGELEILQPPFSMVEQSAVDIMKWANDNGLANMTYGSLGAGILSGAIRELPKFEQGDVRAGFYKFFSEPAFSRVMGLLKVMDKIAEGHGVPVSQVAINWSTQKDFVHTALIGVYTTAHAKENCGAMDWTLTDEEIAILDKEVDALDLK